MNVAVVTGTRTARQRRPARSISQSRRGLWRRYRSLTRRPRLRHPSRPRPSLRHPRTDGTGTGNGIAVTRSQKFRSRRKSGAELDLELGLELRCFGSIARDTAGEYTPQYQPNVRSIGRWISTFRSDQQPRQQRPRRADERGRRREAPALPKIRIEVPAPSSAEPGRAAQPGGAAQRRRRTQRRPACAAVAARPRPRWASWPRWSRTSSAIRPRARRGRRLLPAGEPRGIASAAAEPKSLLLPQAPPAVGVISPPRSASARRSPSRSGSRRPRRPGRAWRGPRRSPRNSVRLPGTRPRRRASGLRNAVPPASPAERRRRPPGLLHARDRRGRFAFAFADATRSVAAEVRAAGEDPDPPPARPG